MRTYWQQVGHKLEQVVHKLVDWLAESDPDTFLEREAGSLIWMGVLILVILPILVITQSFLSHQGLMGNYPMQIRWQAHRYMIGQSLGFFQNEFAGRIATKVMQTALAVREAVRQQTQSLRRVTVSLLAKLQVRNRIAGQTVGTALEKDKFRLKIH